MPILEIGPGALFSSGLIAGGSLTGIAIALMIGTNIGQKADGSPKALIDLFNTGLAERMGATSDLIAIIAFIVLAGLLLKFGLSKEKEKA